MSGVTGARRAGPAIGVEHLAPIGSRFGPGPDVVDVPAGSELSPSEPATVVEPSGGRVASSGSSARRILRVFVQNKLAVMGLVVIVAAVLFSWVGPLLYHTNQTNDYRWPPARSTPRGARSRHVRDPPRIRTTRGAPFGRISRSA
jgi:hypothetical protein